MVKLVILCVDGLDPDFVSDNGFSMEYERRLSIPSELYSKNGTPWSPLVWPSIFSGKLELHYLIIEKRVNPLRLRIRNFLISHGVQWWRKGFKITTKKPFYRLIHMPRVAENLVIDDYSSFMYHIPCVSNDYFFGLYPHYTELEWEQFNVLTLFSNYLEKDIVALYTRIVDHKGHEYIEGNESSKEALREWYKSIFELVNMLKGTVMLVSDHGTLGDHTHHAYLGCTEPVLATDVLDVRRDIEMILDGKG